mgnify:CR=1 FL=1
MVRKFGIVLIICLLAATGIMAALAYTSATVNNPMIISIVNTDEALLSLRPGDLSAVSIDNQGFLSIKPDEGYGFQNNAMYEFANIFFMKNNSRNNVVVSWEVDGSLEELVNTGVLKVFFYSQGRWVEWGTGSVVLLRASQERGVRFVFDTRDNNFRGLKEYGGDFIIHSATQ